MSVFDNAGFVLAHHTLLRKLLVLMRDRNMITERNGIDLFEDALLELETKQGTDEHAEPDVYENGRMVLEVLRYELAAYETLRKRKRRGAPRRR
ncbi:hypothetical protein [Hyphomicrobium sp. CS1BSMeth3]|uniref:hypothetical protein n=1 Tax=Hyphomicrobium sp. CS1BSMeth3 TaxID=1892844 RepID=UPI00092FF174|nr:hypothetical protein [Hyphomicrobium sp. CS1BSMeth3]